MNDSKQTQSIISLDLVRALAALAVMFAHVRGGNWVEFGALPSDQKTIATWAFFFLTRLGHEAVMIFFVLSGFLVGGNLIEGVRSGHFRVGDYVLDRATRILVPLFPACVLTIAINFWAIGQRTSLLELFGNVIGLNGVVVDTLANNAPLWSLAYEIWFYVISGCVAEILVGMAYLLAVGALILCVFVFTVLHAKYLLFWATGALVFRIAKEPNATWLSIPGSILLVGGVIGYQLGSGTKSFQNLSLVSPAAAEAMICGGFALCIPLLCQVNLAWLMRIERPIKLLSEMSFSLYLVHYPINGWWTNVAPKALLLDATSLTLFVAKTLSVMLAGFVFWYLIERPSFMLRHYLRSKSLLKLVYK